VTTKLDWAYEVGDEVLILWQGTEYEGRVVGSTSGDVLTIQKSDGMVHSFNKSWVVIRYRGCAAGRWARNEESLMIGSHGL